MAARRSNSESAGKHHDGRQHWRIPPCRAILAGRGFTRMGTNKALPPIEAVRLIETLLQTLRPLFREAVIVAKVLASYAVLGVPVWCDRIPERGTPGGIYGAVFHSASLQIFCVPCDMPVSNPSVIAIMRDVVSGYDLAVQRTADACQPLRAVYSKSCFPTWKR